ncbi:unnamed protein product [Cuscuta epithymum]|uniref:isochorismate synthase n=1 Tax=Cuscuta epithymum TaxID=186058 RepID=A0AAV0G8Y7_9ASTE|nr:unnamed protein product [Cuscuta epithymum]
MKYCISVDQRTQYPVNSEQFKLIVFLGAANQLSRRQQRRRRPLSSMSDAILRHRAAQLIEPGCFYCSLPSPSLFANRSACRRNHHRAHSSLSMNGCQGDPRAPIGTIQAQTFPAVSSLSLAMESLNSAISNLLNSDPLPFDSGIIRLQVPIKEKIEALAWLHAQNHLPLLPRCYFSSRSRILDTDPSSIKHLIASHPVLSSSSSSSSSQKHRVVSVAGLGSAVFFRDLRPFSFDDWLSIKRFLSKGCPLIRAYGAIRFNATVSIASEWRAFGSFYFMVPQVELDEFEESSMIAATIAWDNSLSWTYRKSINKLQETMCEVYTVVEHLVKRVPDTYVLQKTHIPGKTSWDQAVNRALHMIKGDYSTLIKVVLARSSRVVTAIDIDPLTWLTCLKYEGENAYQFCLQPPESPAFIGNTPEQLFHRDQLSVCSDALAGTRARGGTALLDLKIGHDLLSSPKEHYEFTIVRECIRRRLEAVCSSVLIEPKKALKKLPRVQHLYARLSGRLQSEDDEFKVLSSLHPTPAVCGYPTEVARVLIAETETFDRGMYAGPVGWFGGEESEFAVGIRSALVGKGLGALIYAGTGIVKGSSSSSEWDELELKTSQFTKLMKLEVPALSMSGNERNINQRG